MPSANSHVFLRASDLSINTGFPGVMMLANEFGASLAMEEVVATYRRRWYFGAIGTEGM
jgi:hypothetical protein